METEQETVPTLAVGRIEIIRWDASGNMIGVMVIEPDETEPEDGDD